MQSVDYINIGVLGMSGSGKTVMTEALIRPFDRLIVFDYQEDDAYDNYVVTTNLSSLEKAVKTQPEFAIALRGNTGFFIDSLHIVSQYARNCCIVFDEMSMYAPTRNMPEAMKEIICRGRRKGYVLIWNTQRPKGVNAEVRSQTHAYIVFCMMETLDADYFEVDPQEKLALKQLKVGQFRVYRDRNRLTKFLEQTGRQQSTYQLEF